MNNIQEIKLVIDNNTLVEYEKYYFKQHPRANKKPIENNGGKENTYLGRTKFNVDKNTEKRTCDGIIFDSILEMKLGD